MLRRTCALALFALAGLSASATIARADDADPVDPPYDATIDECADPAANCAPETPDLDDAALETAELAAPTIEDPIEWPVGDVACPEASTAAADGHCAPDATAVATASPTRDV